MRAEPFTRPTIIAANELVAQRRFGRGNKGKSGGVRVVTFYSGLDIPVFLLTVFAKNEASDLSRSEQNALGHFKGADLRLQVEKELTMSKRAFQKIAAGLADAIAIANETADPASYRVHIPERVDVKAIRAKLKLSQAAFAARYGFTVARLRDWEQGRSNMDGPSRILLTVIDKEPEAIERALAST